MTLCAMKMTFCAMEMTFCKMKMTFCATGLILTFPFSFCEINPDSFCEGHFGVPGRQDSFHFHCEMNHFHFLNFISHCGNKFGITYFHFHCPGNDFPVENEYCKMNPGLPEFISIFYKMTFPAENDGSNAIIQPK